MCRFSPRFFFLLCLVVVTPVYCSICPDEVTRTIPPGETCVFVNYDVDGESMASDYHWDPAMELKPGKDCFPETVVSLVHPLDVGECTIRIEVKDVCSWHPDHCWPGDCRDGLAYNCQCREGFELYLTEDPTYSAKQSNRTTKRCRWADKPDLTTCRVEVTDGQGHSTRSTNSGTSTHCSNQQDGYVSTQPARLSFLFKSRFTRTVGPPAAYVADTKIGVVGAKVSVVKASVHGSEFTLMEKDLNQPPMCQHSVSATNPASGGNPHDCQATLTLPQDTAHLQDGERLCVQLTATAGGYYRLQDYDQNYKSTAAFPETSNTKHICFTFDGTKPAHCVSGGGVCAIQPLTLSTRLSRSPNIEVKVDGWTDPQTAGSRSASGLAKFRLEVHDVDSGKDSLAVQPAAITALTQEWNPDPASPGGPYERAVTLPTEPRAGLYALLLEVLDQAGNVAYARRLVLLDNSSSVQLHSSKSLTVVHADPWSNRRWQSDVSKDLCVTWTGRFYNTELKDNDLLARV